MNDATRAANQPEMTRLSTKRGRMRNDTTWKTRVAIVTAMTEMPAKAAMNTGRTRMFRMPRTIAARSAVLKIPRPA